MMNQSQTIAIVGASANRKKYGNKAVRAWKDRGYKVYPINPKEASIEGLVCYGSVREIPESIDIASFYLPPHTTFQVLDEIADKGIKTVYLNPGTEDDAVIDKAKNLGLEVIQACSIMAVGQTPSDYY